MARRKNPAAVALGRRKSPLKAETARENGKRGGRPPKAAPEMPPVDAPCHAGICSQDECAHCLRIAEIRREMTRDRSRVTDVDIRDARLYWAVQRNGQGMPCLFGPKSAAIENAEEDEHVVLCAVSIVSSDPRIRAERRMLRAREPWGRG
jgi:hypothetical protein